MLRRFPKGPPLLDPAKDMKIETPALAVFAGNVKRLNARLDANAFNSLPAEEKEERYERYLYKVELLEKKSALEKEIKATQALPLKDTLRRMKMVLRRLGHTDKDNVVQLKGRVACELSTCDELLLTELVLGGTFNDLTPAVCAALVSCAVFGEGKGEDVVRMKPDLETPFKKLQEAAKRVAEVQYDAKIAIDRDEYVRNFKPDLMEDCLCLVQGRQVQGCSCTQRGRV